jgi:glycolate oxidase iron-sulfur subunit
VRYGFLLERARAVIADARGVHPGVRFLLGMFRHPLLMRVSLGASALFRDSGLAGLLLRIAPRGLARPRFALAMLAGSRPRPEWRRRSGRRAAPRSRAASPGTSEIRPTAAPRVAILRGCVQSVLFARVNEATEDVLRARGCALADARGQGCCGALHAHAGLLDDARDLARRNVRAFDASGADLIAVNAAGCGAFMKEYGELLEDDASLADAARHVAARTRDVAEIVMRELPTASATEEPVREPTTRRLRVAYDEACHLHHGQGVHVEPYRLLQSIGGIELVPLERAAECCGGAGIYGLMHPDLGGRILRDKIDAIEQAAPDLVVTANPGCAMQIAAGLLLRGNATPVVHPMELLAFEDSTSD